MELCRDTIQPITPSPWMVSAKYVGVPPFLSFLHLKKCPRLLETVAWSPQALLLGPAGSLSQLSWGDCLRNPHS